MSLNLVPLGHRVIIDPQFESQEIEDGALKGFLLELDEDSYERQKAMTQVGKVVAIGPTAWKPEGLGGVPWCKIGDVIYYAKHAHKIIHDGDKEYFIINDEDCQCLIKEEIQDFLDEE